MNFTRSIPAHWTGSVLAAAMLAYASAQLWLSRGTTLFIDEVSMFQQNGGLHPSALAAPFNEHLELARRLLYAICLPVFGASGSFLAAKLVLIAAVWLLALVLYAFLSRRIGRIAALAPVILLLFFGSGWELNFVISGIGNVIALAAGAAALLVCERCDLRGDLAACALLVIAVVSFTTGIAFAVGAGVMVVAQRGPWRRLWVAAAPLAVYAAWLIWVRVVYVPTHGEVQHISAFNLLLIPNMIAQQGASTAGALSGLNYNFEPSDSFSVFSTSSPYGGVLAALAAAALIWHARRNGHHPLLWGLIGALLAYWVELAVGSGVGRTPTTVRYTYAASVIAVLLASAARNAPLAARRSLAILGCVTAVALLGNLARLRDGMGFLRAFGTTMRAQLSAIEIAAPSESPSFQTRLGQPQFVPVGAGPYLRAVRRYGSPAYSDTELRRQSPTLRAAADSMLVAALGIHPQAVLPARRSPACAALPAAGAAVRAPGVTLSAASPAQLTLSRYGDLGISAGSLANGFAELRIPPDRSGQPWRLRATPGGAVRLCG